jgi:hypothetical protein
VLRISSKMVCSAMVSAGHRHAGEAQPRGERPAGGHALAQVDLLGTQPDGIAEGGRVLHRALQHLRVQQRHLGLAEADAAGLRELRHLGEHLAAEVAREGAQREHARLVQLLARNLSMSTRPGSSSTGSVSGGHTRLVTPPATAAAISLSSMPSCSWPGSRRRADRSTRPGATMQPPASSVRLGLKPSGTLPRPMIRPAASATSQISSKLRPGSMTRPLRIRSS